MFGRLLSSKDPIIQVGIEDFASCLDRIRTR